VLRRFERPEDDSGHTLKMLSSTPTPCKLTVRGTVMPTTATEFAVGLPGAIPAGLQPPIILLDVLGDARLVTAAIGRWSIVSRIREKIEA